MIKAPISRVVSIGDREIRDGVAGDVKSCPLALALRSMWPDAKVYCSMTWSHPDEDEHPFMHSAALEAWIHRFDSHERVDPIDVAISVEDELLWIC